MAVTQEDGGAVLQAKEYLKSVMEGKPSAFRGPYTRQIAGLYDRIVNRSAFRYDEGNDLLPFPDENRDEAEEQAFQRYVRQLKNAARDGGEADAWLT